LRVDSRQRLERYLDAMQAVIDRHDILRTSVMWEGLPEPVQIVWRKAALPVEEVELPAAGGDAIQQMQARFNLSRYRMDVRKAPLMRIKVAYDAAQDQWLVLRILHHLAWDHTTVEVMEQEIEAHLLGEEDRLPTPLPFRDFVAQAQLGVSAEEYQAFFRRMLGDVVEPTAPYGLLSGRSDGKSVEDARLRVDHALARRLREQARKLGVSAASLFHVAWARVLARLSGRDDIVFGTVLFGRMEGAAGSDRVMGPFINTLPVRIVIGQEPAAATVKGMHTRLAELLRYEHAPLAIAQRCSGVPAPTPLFSALLNYRHSADVMRARPDS